MKEYDVSNITKIIKTFEKEGKVKLINEEGKYNGDLTISTSHLTVDKLCEYLKKTHFKSLIFNKTNSI